MPTSPPASCDVAIVGGGPAGLAAATALREAGVGSVVVLDREPEVGGIPRHCGHYPFGLREFRQLLRGPDYARRLAERARSAGVTIHTGVTVTGLAVGPRLSLSHAGGASELSAKKVLLATGVRERTRAARLIGGSKPGGVLSTGALQGLVYLDGIRPFRRPVILGTELVAFSALLTCRHLGIRPVAMIEPNDRVTAFRAAQFAPALLGVPLHLGTELIAIHGDRQVEEVVLRRRGETRTLSTDGVVVTGQFLPEASLLAGSHLELDAATGGPAVDEFGRCSDADFFAAGNLLRAVETAGWSWEEGRAAGRLIARVLEGDLTETTSPQVVSVRGDALKYAVPQRLVSGLDGSGSFQLRVRRPARGELRVRVGKTVVWSRKVTAVPEQRILVPFAAVPHSAAGDIDFELVEH